MTLFNFVGFFMMIRGVWAPFVEACFLGVPGSESRRRRVVGGSRASSMIWVVLRCADGGLGLFRRAEASVLRHG